MALDESQKLYLSNQKGENQPKSEQFIMPEKWLSNHKHSFYVPKSQMRLHLTLLQDNLLNVGRYGFLIAYIIISAGINELLGPEQNRPCKKVASWLNTNSFIVYIQKL